MVIEFQARRRVICETCGARLDSYTAHPSRGAPSAIGEAEHATTRCRRCILESFDELSRKRREARLRELRVARRRDPAAG